MLNKSIIAVIPARGGSKGVPRKNVRLLIGKPLIAYTIENALKAKGIDRVFVSTDDYEIASISERYGADVIMRPKEISDDMASSEAAILHALGHLQKRENKVPDTIVFLQCTSPLTLPQDIDATIEVLIQEKADSALSVTPFHHFLWRKIEKRNLIGINHNKKVRNLRQDMEIQYLETGAVYVMRTKGFIKAKHRFFGKISMYIMPKERYLDIDEEADFSIAEVLLKLQGKKNIVELLPNYISALVLDFDGVFTDNRVLVFENGKEAVICNRSDGYGIEKIMELNIPILVISREKNSVISKRCKKLGIEYYYGIENKLNILYKWLTKNKFDSENIIYVGNDENDIECLNYVGCPIAVADAHQSARNVSKIILKSCGGFGAIREVCDLIENNIGNISQ